MPNIVMTKLKEPSYDKDVKAKIFTFLLKLQEDDTSVGLHIEKMAQAVDPRARTARVDQSLRAVLYCLDTPDAERVYVYAGTWSHDVAIERARSRKLQVNPVNGIAELIEVTTEASTTVISPAVPAASHQQATGPFLVEAGYIREDLIGLGFDVETTERLFAAGTDNDLLAISEGLENQWQQTAVLGLAVGDSAAKIAADLDLEKPAAETVDEDVATEDSRILESLARPASQMQFTLFENDEELRRVLDDGDFGAWRVFLHPEQRKYATHSYNGPFRLTGGAGTGKTVVLLHRARELQRKDPSARIVLTTFTKALAGNLQRDMERLDPAAVVTDQLGASGILIRGIDALAASVKELAGDEFAEAASAVFGSPLDQNGAVRANRDGWREAIDDVDPALPETILTPSFFEAEYLQVILPNLVTSLEEYSTVRRPGRGVALDRSKRVLVWSVVEQYRKNARLFGNLSFAEIAEVAAAWLRTRPSAAPPFVDHVLIDEGQDLVPSHWRLVRALAPEGQDDVFIAEDAHQRIYGQHVVLSRYGLKITGRSRRLTLNYRTTEENLRYAMRVLAGGSYIDADNETEGVTGYRSARRGPAPTLRATDSDDEQLTAIADQIRQWIEEGVVPGTIAVLARSNNRAKHVQNALTQNNIPSDLLTAAKSHLTKPVVMTMHTAKGMEFSRVILFDVSEGSIPLPAAFYEVAPEEMDDAMLRERSLLYVAATRARDEVVVTWKGNPSSLASPPAP
jgi:superfamily I DNA/RNA helicase